MAFTPEIKFGHETKGALNRLFKQTKRRLVIVQTDKGTKFWNSEVQNFLKKYQIKFFTTFSERKASIVELSITQLKESCLDYLQETTTEDISTSSMKSLTGITTHIIEVST